jgi:hypothetical protein
MFAGSRESVVPRIRRDISGQKNYAYRFLLHQGDFQCWKPDQQLQNSISVIPLMRYFQGCTMKRGEFQAKGFPSFFSSHGEFDVS